MAVEERSLGSILWRPLISQHFMEMYHTVDEIFQFHIQTEGVDRLDGVAVPKGRRALPHVNHI